MKMLAKLKTILDRPRHPVASLSVQAEAGEKAQNEWSPFWVLVFHLFSSFFTRDNQSSDSRSTTQAIQIAAALGIPAFMLAVILIPSYTGLSPFATMRPLWVQIQDRFLFVTYSYAVIGIVALLKSATFFPTLPDVLVLGFLPISKHRLFSAKVTAAVLFMGLYLLGTNLPAALLLSSIAGSASFVRYFVAHILAVMLGGCFAATSSLAGLALIDLLVGAAVSRFVAPVLQASLIASLLVLLVLSPLVAPLIQRVLSSSSPTVYWFPPLWFLGLDEYVLGVSHANYVFAQLADIAVAATVASCLLLIMLYPLAYQRKVVQLLEGDKADRTRCRPFGRVPQWLERVYLPLYSQRAMYHFVGQTLFRVQRFRITVLISTGVGVAIGMLQLADFQITTGYPILATKSLEPVIPVAISLFGMILGVYLSLSSAHEPAAAWLFTSIIGRPGRGLSSGVRRWVALFACTSGTAALFIAWLLLPHRSSGSGDLVRQCLTLLGWGIVFTEIFFVQFRDVPFAAARLQQRAIGVLLLIYVFVVFPLSISAVKLLGYFARTNWLAVALWVFLVVSMLFCLDRWYEQIDLQPWIAEEDEAVQRLGL
jgi:hypothetical protein